MKISERFQSLQGEGCHVGQPATFIRFKGCVLRCDFCDTKYAWGSCEGEFSASDNSNLIEYIKTGPKLVVFTGGEPLMHYKRPEFKLLISELIRLDFRVSFETTFIPRIELFDGSNTVADIYKLLWKEWGWAIISKCHFTISPKLNVDYYSIDITEADIHDFYSIDDTDATAMYALNHVNYKLVYKSYDVNKIQHLIDHGVPKWWRDKNVYIMPLSLSSTLEDSHSEMSIKHQQKENIAAAEFCMVNNVRYSPRMHLDVWGNKKGV